MKSKLATKLSIFFVAIFAANIAQASNNHCTKDCPDITLVQTVLPFCVVATISCSSFKEVYDFCSNEEFSSFEIGTLLKKMLKKKIYIQYSEIIPEESCKVDDLKIIRGLKEEENAAKKHGQKMLKKKYKPNRHPPKKERKKGRYNY